jgi:plasmid rolling circle replication initiator protein Rep
MSKFYLTDLSSKDKPWDIHRRNADLVGVMYQQVDYLAYADRIESCSQVLFFGSALDDQGRAIIRLKSARFCRVRNCPICQWRRSLMWKARLGKVLPLIGQDYPKVRWLHLTLAIRNCEITSLRDNLKLMNAAWKRLTELKIFPAIGWFKSLEITRGEDGTAHPHFHILLMVNSSYFQGANYIKQDKWIQCWKKSLRVDYDPTSHIQAIKGFGEDSILDAVKEVAKYTVKGDDLVAEQEWLAEYTRQVHKMRAIAVGGILKKYLSEEEATNDELVVGDAEGNPEDITDPYYFAHWDKPDGRYTIDTVNS